MRSAAANPFSESKHHTLCKHHARQTEQLIWVPVRGGHDSGRVSEEDRRLRAAAMSPVRTLHHLCWPCTPSSTHLIPNQVPFGEGLVSSGCWCYKRLYVDDTQSLCFSGDASESSQPAAASTPPSSSEATQVADPPGPPARADALPVSHALPAPS